MALAAFIFACSRCDAWAIVANPRLVPRELDQIYGHSGARRIFITTAVSGEAADHAARLGAAFRQIGPFWAIGVGALNETTRPEYKRPCEIVLLDRLPSASTGKILKHKLWDAARATTPAEPPVTTLQIRSA